MVSLGTAGVMPQFSVLVGKTYIYNTANGVYNHFLQDQVVRGLIHRYISHAYYIIIVLQRMTHLKLINMYHQIMRCYSSFCHLSAGKGKITHYVLISLIQLQYDC